MILFLRIFCNVRTIFDKNNIIDTFYNLLFTNEQKKLNCKNWIVGLYWYIYYYPYKQYSHTRTGIRIPVYWYDYFSWYHSNMVTKFDIWHPIFVIFLRTLFSQWNENVKRTTHWWDFYKNAMYSRVHNLFSSYKKATTNQYLLIMVWTYEGTDYLKAEKLQHM